MLKAIEQLVKGERTSVGNHRCRSYSEGNHQREDYIYHCTAICMVDHTTRKFMIDKGEYGDKMSTNRAVKDYRDYFNANGYEEVFKSHNDMKDYLVETTQQMYRCYLGDLVRQFAQVTIIKKKGIEPVKYVAELYMASESYAESFSFEYKGPKTLEREIYGCFSLWFEN